MVIRGIIAALTATSIAHAQITNGDFDANSFQGWALEYGTHVGSGVVQGWSGTQPAGHPTPTIITAATPLLPGQALDVDPYNGNFMARINDLGGGRHATRLSQTITLSVADIGAALSLSWGAILVTGYSAEDQPFVSIEILRNGVPVSSYRADAKSASEPASGWQVAGITTTGMSYYTSRFDQLPLSADKYSPGDLIKVAVVASDCPVMGHGGCAFIDSLRLGPLLCAARPGAMVGWWPMDEVSGSIANDIMNGHHGTYSTPASPVPVPGKVQGALRFLPEETVTVADDPMLDFGPAQDFSIDAWVMKGGGVVHFPAPIASKIGNTDPYSAPGYHFYLTQGPPERIALDLFDGVTLLHFESPVGIIDQDWHHVAVTVYRGPGGGRFYLDGQIVGEFDAALLALADLSNDRPLYLGNVPFNPGPLHGYRLDEVEVFRSALTPNEVLTIFQADVVGKCRSGIRQWTVNMDPKVSEAVGGFGGVLDPLDSFGDSATPFDDFNGDGILDVLVGAPGDDDGGTDQGTVWILFLSSDGTVSAQQKISETQGGFGGVLDPNDRFGSSVAASDISGDGVMDLVVGAPGDDDGGTGQGAVWVLFLDSDGTVASEQKISETQGGFGGLLDPQCAFGSSVAVGDIDEDGTSDLVVGAPSDGGTDLGAVWVLFMNSDGTVASEQRISEAQGGFGGLLGSADLFGCSVAAAGDLDGDGIRDLAVGACGDSGGGVDQGAVWILFLNSDGTVASEQKISETQGGFGGVLDPGDALGGSVAALGDLDGNGIGELAVGASSDDDGGIGQGALWILFLNADGTVASEQKISETQGGFGGVLDPGDAFGGSIAALGDLDGDGIGELAVGASSDDDGGNGQGAIWILFLTDDTTAPTISFPPLVSVIDPKRGAPGETVFFSVTANDERDPAPSVVCVPPSGSFFPPGITLVTCTATDASGNQSVCTLAVEVVRQVRGQERP